MIIPSVFGQPSPGQNDELVIRQALENASPQEIQILCSHQEGMGLPLLSHFGLEEAYKAIWFSGRYDLLLDLWEKNDLPDHYFCTWPKSAQIALGEILLKQHKQNKALPKINLGYIVNNFDRKNALIAACLSEHRHDLLRMLEPYVGPNPQIENMLYNPDEQAQSLLLRLSNLASSWSLPPASEKLIAHLWGNTFVGNTKYEGMPFREACEFLIKSLEAKDNIRQQPVYPLSKRQELLGIFNQLKTILTEITSIKGERGDKDSRLRRLGDRIVESIKSNAKVYLPGGWTTLQNGHAMVYIVEKERSGNGPQTYRFTAVNTGAGGQYHHSKSIGNKKKIYPLFTLTGVPAHEIESSGFWTFLMGFQTHIPDREDKGHNESRLYNYITSSLTGKKVDYSKVPDSALISPQQSGICPMMVLMKILRSELPRDEYFAFKLRLRLVNLYRFCQDKHIFDRSQNTNESAYSLFLHTHRKLISFALKAKDRGQLGQDDLLLLAALLSELEKSKQRFPNPPLKLKCSIKNIFQWNPKGSFACSQPEPVNLSHQVKADMDIAQTSLGLLPQKAHPTFHAFTEALKGYVAHLKSLKHLGKENEAAFFAGQVMRHFPRLVDAKNSRNGPVKKLWNDAGLEDLNAAASLLCEFCSIYQGHPTDNRVEEIVDRTYLYYLTFRIMKQALEIDTKNPDILDKVKMTSPFMDKFRSFPFPVEDFALLQRIEELERFDNQIRKGTHLWSFSQSHGQRNQLEYATDADKDPLTFLVNAYLEAKQSLKTVQQKDKDYVATAFENRTHLPAIFWKFWDIFFITHCNVDVDGDTPVEASLVKQKGENRKKRFKITYQDESIDAPEEIVDNICKAISLSDKSELKPVKQLEDLESLRVVNALAHFIDNAGMLLNPLHQQYLFRLLFEYYSPKEKGIKIKADTLFAWEFSGGNRDLLARQLATLLRMLKEIAEQNRSADLGLFLYRLQKNAIEFLEPVLDSDNTKLLDPVRSIPVATTLEFLVPFGDDKAIELQHALFQLKAKAKPQESLKHLLKALFLAGYQCPTSQQFYRLLHLVHQSKQALQALSAGEINQFLIQLLSDMKVPFDPLCKPVGTFPEYQVGPYRVNLLTSQIKHQNRLLQSPHHEIMGKRQVQAALNQETVTDFTFCEGLTESPSTGIKIADYKFADQLDHTLVSISQKRLEEILAAHLNPTSIDYHEAQAYFYLDQAARTKDSPLDGHNLIKHGKIPLWFLHSRFDIWVAHGAKQPHLFISDPKEGRVIQVTQEGSSLTVIDLKNGRRLIPASQTSAGNTFPIEFSTNVLCWKDERTNRCLIELPRYKLEFEEKEEKLFCKQHRGFYLVQSNRLPIAGTHGVLLLQNSDNKKLLLVPKKEFVNLRTSEAPMARGARLTLDPNIHQEFSCHMYTEETQSGSHPTWKGNLDSEFYLAKLYLFSEQYDEALALLRKNYSNAALSKEAFQELVAFIKEGRFNQSPQACSLFCHALLYLLPKGNIEGLSSSEIEQIYRDYQRKYHNLPEHFKLPLFLEKQLSEDLKQRFFHSSSAFLDYLEGKPVDQKNWPPVETHTWQVSLFRQKWFLPKPYPRGFPEVSRDINEKYTPKEMDEDSYGAYLYEILVAMAAKDRKKLEDLLAQLQFYRNYSRHVPFLNIIARSALAGSPLIDPTDPMMEQLRQISLTDSKPLLDKILDKYATALTKRTEEMVEDIRREERNEKARERNKKAKITENKVSNPNSFIPNQFIKESGYGEMLNIVQNALEHKNRLAKPEVPFQGFDVGRFQGFAERYVICEPVEAIQKPFPLGEVSFQDPVLQGLLDHHKQDFASSQKPKKRFGLQSDSIDSLKTDLQQFLRDALSAEKKAQEAIRQFLDTGATGKLSARIIPAVHACLHEQLKRAGNAQDYFQSALIWYISLKEAPECPHALQLAGMIENCLTTGCHITLARKALEKLQANPHDRSVKDHIGKILSHQIGSIENEYQVNHILLYFQYITKKVLEPFQLDLYRASLEPGKKAFQLGCGKGKTSVVTFLLLLTALMRGEIPVNLVPSFNLETNFKDLKTAFHTLTPFSVKLLQFNRSCDAGTQAAQQLQNYLQNQEKIRNVFIGAPESLQSLELKYIEQLKHAMDRPYSNTKEINRSLTAFEKMLVPLMEKGYAVMDEVHVILRALAKLTYALQDNRSLPAYHWEVPAILFEAMVACNRQAGAPPYFPYGDRRKESWDEEAYQKTLKPRLAAMLASHPSLKMPQEQRGLAERYLLADRKRLANEERQQLNAWLNALSPDEAKRWKLLRAQLNIFLPHALATPFKLKYGASLHDDEEQAVPYLHKDNPSPNSQFEKPEALVNYTYLLYLNQGLKATQVAKLVMGWQSAHRKQLSNLPEKGETHQSQRFAQKFPHIPLGIVNPQDANVQKELVKAFANDPEAIFEYLQVYLFPQLTTQKFKISSTAANLAKILLARITAFSGTPTNHPTYPVEMSYTPEEGSDAAMLEALTNADITTLQETEDLSPRALAGLAGNPRFQFFLDPQGYIDDKTNEAVIQEIMEADPQASWGIFFDSKSNEIMMKDRQGNILPYNDDLAGDDNVGYLDEKHCEGTNLPARPDATGWLIVNKGLTFTRLSQAAKRLRQYGNGAQKLRIFLAPSHAAEIRNKFGSLNHANFVLWTLCNESSEISKCLFPAFQQQIQAIYRSRLFQRLASCQEIDDDTAQMSARLMLYKKYAEVLLETLNMDEFEEHASIDPPISAKEQLQNLAKEYESKFAHLLNLSDIDLLEKTLAQGCRLLSGNASDAAEQNQDMTSQQEAQRVQQLNEQMENRFDRFYPTGWDVEKFLLHSDFEKTFLRRDLADLAQTGYVSRASQQHLEPAARLFPEAGFDQALFFTENFLGVRTLQPLARIDFDRREILMRGAPEEMIEKFRKYMPDVRYVLSVGAKDSPPRYIALHEKEAEDFRAYLFQVLTSPKKQASLAHLNISLLDIHGDDLGSVPATAEKSHQRAIAQFNFLNGEIIYTNGIKAKLLEWLQEADVKAKEAFFLSMRKIRKKVSANPIQYERSDLAFAIEDIKRRTLPAGLAASSSTSLPFVPSSFSSSSSQDHAYRGNYQETVHKDSSSDDKPSSKRQRLQEDNSSDAERNGLASISSSTSLPFVPCSFSSNSQEYAYRSNHQETLLNGDKASHKRKSLQEDHSVDAEGNGTASMHLDTYDAEFDEIA